LSALLLSLEATQDHTFYFFATAIVPIPAVCDVLNGCSNCLTVAPTDLPAALTDLTAVQCSKPLTQVSCHWNVDGVVTVVWQMYIHWVKTTGALFLWTSTR